MKTIAIMNVKGGVGKTMTACNMAHILAKDYRQRVLLLDADPQGDASEFFGAGSVGAGMTELLTGAQPAEELIVGTDYDRLELIPSDSSLFSLDIEAVADPWHEDYTGKIAALSRAAAAENTHDLILIDCPPAFTPSAVAALKAADSVIIPVKMDSFSLRGMDFLLDQLVMVHRINGAAKLEGVLVTIWHNCDVCVKLEEHLRSKGIRVFDTHIRRSDMADESTVMRSPIREYSARCAAAQDYRDFVAEFVKTGGLNNG